ncbi:MAG: bifunctional YncE family protein/alkaline phosphatase family protein [Gemmatimonadetes bacterium]|nr:bifunctional YncE family protein/alkaline phosphatase family protein [Gemmatimonadota bacterium]
MLIATLFALQAVPTPPRKPDREIADPGIVATNQRITPAGVQSVFNGRVAGVRFAAAPGELWVSVPGAAYRIGWKDNVLRGSARFDGRPGVQGVAIDPVNGRALISTVGRLPADLVKARAPGGDKLPRTKSFAQLFVYDGDSLAGRTGGRDSLVVRAASPALGEYMAGGMAIARRANASGRRVIALPLPANDELAILDAENGSLLKKVALGVLPFAAVINDDGTTAYVSVFGGPKPTATDRAAKQFGDPFAEPVRIDARGIALAGTVTKVDLVAGTVSKVIPVGLHPTGLAWDAKGERLYVANGNSDAVSVIDTRRDSVVGTITITPFRERKAGLTPTAVATSPDGGTLFVTLGGANAVAVYSLAPDRSASGARLRGMIPTSWYPSSIDVSADGRTIAVGTLFGVGAGTGRTSGMDGRYVFAERGAVSVIAVPSEAELSAFTTSVAQNNRLHLATGPQAPSIEPRANVAARAVPERPGEPSLIRNVVYIIKENRTYDQVFGDIGKGASDPSLVQYGRDVTPNAHALAEQFVLIDHFFASGGNSADGHQWLTQAAETEYPMWPLYYGRTYPSEGNDPLAYASGGFLWEAARAKGHTVSIFGEYAPAPPRDDASVRSKLLAMYRDSQPHNAAFFRAQLAKQFNTHSDIPSLDSLLVREYPGWTQEIPDVVKADVILEHLKVWESGKVMPNLVMIILPNDHTQGTSAGWCAPKSCVADNDRALGLIVEGLSKSSFWKSMAIVVVEDDAQNGVDHIDGHRTVAMVASPYARRGTIDDTFYSQPSMVKTVELMLGLPALSMFDLVATDMRASFIGPDEKPDFTPYSALVPKQSLYEVNQQVGAIKGAFAAERRSAALASGRMNFREPDAAPSDKLNKILWHDARGYDTPYPGVKQSLFFPLSVTIDDDDREDVKDKAKKKTP